MNYRLSAIFLSFSACSFILATLLTANFKFEIPFAYSQTGDITPTNTTVLQLWTTHGTTYLDGIVQPSTRCEEAFSLTTCSLLYWSGYFVGAALLVALLTLGLAAYFSLRSSKRKGLASTQANSSLWLIYATLPITCFLALVISIILASVASQRLLESELPDATTRTITKGIRKAVKATVSSGIEEQWALLNQAAEVLDWQSAFGAIASDSTNKTGLYNPSLSAACNLIDSTAESNVDPLALLAETQMSLDCIRIQTAAFLPNLSIKKHLLFHSTSLVKAFNTAFSLSLPTTLYPESLHRLIEDMAYSRGNSTFANMANTIHLTVHSNVKLSYGPAWYLLIFSSLVVLFLYPFVKGDWYQRFYYMNHHFVDVKSESPTDLGV